MRTFHVGAMVITDMLKCYTPIPLHIWTTSAHVSGSIKLGHLGCARSSVLLLPSLNLLHQSNTAISCKQLSLYMCLIQELMNAGLAPSAHRNQMTQCSMCLDESITVLHWATCCCAEFTQSSLFMMCGYRLMVSSDHCQTAQEWLTSHCV